MHTICLSGIPTTLETRQDRSLDYVLAWRMTRISAAKVICIHNKLIKSQSSHKAATHFRGQPFQLPDIFRFFHFLRFTLEDRLRLWFCFRSIKTPPSSQTFRSQKVFLLCTVAHNCHGKIFLLTAKSISSQLNQFRHGKINFITAKSISPRQNQFRKRKINLATEKSISPRINQFYTRHN